MPSSLSTLSNAKGATTKRYFKGRGRGSGNGKTAGKGTKGQGAHAKTKKHGFEGGQTPLYRRLPKFGARKTHSGVKTVYAIVNLEQLNRFEDGSTVDATLLVESGLVKRNLSGVKILGKGSLNKKLIVKADAFSASAKKAIEGAGGQIELVKA